MNLELKLLIFWIAVTFGLWIATKVHFAISKSSLNWKYFVEDYSWVGATYYLSKWLGCVVMVLYAIVKVTMWWFTV
jgi:hypothetical protein